MPRNWGSTYAPAASPKRCSLFATCRDTSACPSCRNATTAKQAKRVSLHEHVKSCEWFPKSSQRRCGHRYDIYKHALPLPLPACGSLPLSLGHSAVTRPATSGKATLRSKGVKSKGIRAYATRFLMFLGLDAMARGIAARPWRLPVSQAQYTKPPKGPVARGVAAGPRPDRPRLPPSQTIHLTSFISRRPSHTTHLTPFISFI